ncbi:MAG: hypothetical protein MUC96_25925 [Myxococcaceae bacterium]|jgi:hypothetical protein|nr:hypothetical protein [Myxococcaceae bacterium]
MAALQHLDEGVWMDTAPVQFLGLQLTANMTVLRLRDGLLVHSPIPLTPDRRRAVEALGPVTHLYAPNLMHHLRLGDWAAQFPGAQVHGPPGLGRKRRDLDIDRVHGEPAPAFEGLVDELRIDGFRLEESVLFHRPSRTLVVADAVHQIGRPAHWWTRTYTTLAGFYDRVALSRVIRWSSFADRAAARRSLDRILSLPFQRIVVGHGAVITTDPHRALAEAYAWLRAPTPLRLSGGVPSGCS